MLTAPNNEEVKLVFDTAYVRSFLAATTEPAASFVTGI